MCQFNPIQERQSETPEERPTQQNPNDHLYEGTYRLGQRDGYGVLKNKTGRIIYDGNWSKG